MKDPIIFIFCLFSVSLFSQVTSVDYLMKYNCETNQYDVNIVILAGSATTVPQRAQFNSQISIVVPTGETVGLTEMYMPLKNNQVYTGTDPINWTLSTPKIAPEAQPENDFYGVTPNLSPAGFYNDLEVGNIVKLFSFTAGTTGQYDENVRFYKNGVDPDKSDVGMGGSNFFNGFTMGGSTQLYNGNIEQSCVTDIEEHSQLKVNVFPNPFQNQFTIELQDDIHNIQIIDTEGKVYYYSGNKSKGILSINANDYPRGIYYTRIVMKNGLISSQRIMKL